MNDSTDVFLMGFIILTVIVINIINIIIIIKISPFDHCTRVGWSPKQQ